jgi:hypothetical protein
LNWRAPLMPGVRLLSINYRHKITAFGVFILGGLYIEKIFCIYFLPLCVFVASVQ